MTSRGDVTTGLLGALGIKIFPDMAGFGDELTSGVINATTAKAAFVGQALQDFGQAVFTKFTLPLAVATTANIAQFQALDREIRTVLTLFGTAPSLVDETFEEMRAGISGVSKEIGGLERDIADGLYQAISAGVPRGGVFEFLDVAQMAAIADKTADLTTAVDGLTTVVNAFGIDAANVAEVSDVMFTTVALGKTTFGELSQSIGRVAPLAANAGVAFEELFAIIGATTLQGLQTSEAISFLRAGITGLLRPTDELNAIFRELGFETAEAAIPVIGLQAAFQAVVDAAGGSTSKLQELIGTSEGVSAILGVTGENAENFAKVMAGVESSTGATSRAFEIMDQGAGRTFGRLTESLDRMGNTFGELGSELVLPFVEAATVVASDLADGFRNLLPYAEELGTMFSNFLSAFRLPVLREVTSFLSGIAVSIGGLIGVLGGVLLPLGFFIKSIANIVFATRAFKLLRKPVEGAGNALKGFAAEQKRLNLEAQVGGKRLSRYRRVMGGLGKTAGLLGGGLLKNIGAAFALGIAIQGLFVIYTKWRDHVREVTEANQIFTTQLDKLAENAGLANNAITFEGLQNAEGNIRGFIAENIELIRSLNETKDLLGDTALQEQILAIGAQLIWKGNTPEEVQGVVDQLAQATGIEIPISFTTDEGGLDPSIDLLDASLGGIQATADKVGTLIARRVGESTTKAAESDPILESLFQLSPQLEGQVDDIAKSLANTLAVGFAEGRGSEVLDVIQQVSDALGPEADARLFTTMRQELETISGIDLPFQLYTSSIEGLKDSFRDTSLDIEALVSQESAIAVGNRLRALNEDFGTIPQTIQEEVIPLSEEALAFLAQVPGRLTGIFQKGRDFIKGTFQEIQTGFTNQIPLFDIYEGALDINFDAWIAGHEAFQSDLADIQAFISGPLSEMPAELQAAFNAAPVSEQAWLAQLSPDNLEKALETLTASLGATQETGLTSFTQKLPETIATATGLIEEELAGLVSDAEAAGVDTETKFTTAIGKAETTWPRVIKSALNGINSELATHVFPTVSIPAPVVVGPRGNVAAPGNVIYETNVTLEGSGNTVEDAERAAALLEINR